MTDELKNVITLTTDDFKKAAKGAADSVKEIGDKLDDVDGTDLKGINREIKAMTRSVKEAGKSVFSLHGGLSTLKNGMNDTAMAAKSFMAQISKWLSLAMIVAGIKAAIDEGAGSLASEAQFSQVFGQLEHQAVSALQSIAEYSGFTAYSMRDAFSSIGAYAKVTGMDTSEALSLTERAMRAATDSAAFYDRELNDVVESLKSYLKGNFANDAALGLASTETTRNAMAMRLYGQEFKNLTEIQKQWTLLAQVEEANELSGALGQAAREANNWSTNVQRLTSQFKALISVVGKGFIAIVNPVLTAINTILAGLVEFANSVADVFGLVFGSVAADIPKAAVNTSDLSGGLDNVADTAGSAAKGVKKIGKATKDTTKAVKELIGQLMGFDEINRMGSNVAAGISAAPLRSPLDGIGSGSGALSIGGIASEIAGQSVLQSAQRQLTDFQRAFKSWLEDIKRAAKAGDWAGVGYALASGFGYAVNFLRLKVNSPELKKTIKDAVDVVTGLCNGFFAALSFTDGTKQSIASSTGALIAEAFSLALATINQLIRGLDWYSIAKSVSQFIQGAFVAFDWSQLTQLASNIVIGALDFVAGLYDGINWKTLPSDLFDAVVKAIKGVDWDGIRQAYTSAFTAALNATIELSAGVVTLGVKLAKMGWTTVREWIGAIPSTSQAISLAKSGWSSVKAWLGEIPAVNQAVSLAKNGWNSVKAWIGDLPGVAQGVSLAKSGWSSVKAWLGEIPAVNQAVSLAKSGWTSVKAWIGEIPGVAQAVSLAKSGWTSVKAWLGDLPGVAQAVSLAKSGWTSVKAWIGDLTGISQAVSLVKSGWTSVKAWIGTLSDISQGVSLAKSGWTSVKAWIGTLSGISQAVSLAKSGWTSVKAWIGTLSGISQGVSLAKSGWTSVKAWIGDIKPLSATINLLKGWSGSVASALGLTNLSSKFTIKLPTVSVSWSNDTIPLPKFSVKWNAKGAILNGAQLFGMMGNTLLGGGEAGREAVLPLDRNTGWMDDLADKLANRIGGSSSRGPETITVYVTLDGRIVGRSVVNYIRDQGRVGNYPLSGYI